MKLSGLVVIALAVVVLGVVAGWGAAFWTYHPRHEHFAPNNAERPYQSAGTSEPDNAPKGVPRVLVRNGERYDFGKMTRGAQGKYVFYVMNTGDAPLTLKKGQTTCKCTLSTLGNGIVQPGEVAAVELEWTVKSDENYFSQTAELLTNDPERPVVALRVEGYVEDVVRLTPDEIVFQNVAGNETAKRQLFVYAARAEDNIRVEQVSFVDSSTAHFYSAEVRDLTAEELAAQPMAKAGQVITITLKPGLPTGEIQQSMRVKLSLPDMPEQIIPIRGLVQSDVSVVGRLGNYDPQLGLLSFGLVEQQKGAQAEMTVLLKGDHRDQIQVEVDEVDPAECLQVTLGERRNGDRLITIPLTIQVKPGAPRVTRLGSDQGKLGVVVLRSTNAQTKQVRIHVRFAIN